MLLVACPGSLWNDAAELTPYGSGYEPASLNCLPERDVVLAVVAEAERVRVVGRGAVDVELPLEREAAEHLRAAPGRARNSRLIRVVDPLALRIERVEVESATRRGRGRPAVDRDRLAGQRVVDRERRVVRVLQRIAGGLQLWLMVVVRLWKSPWNQLPVSDSRGISSCWISSAVLEVPGARIVAVGVQRDGAEVRRQRAKLISQPGQSRVVPNIAAARRPARCRRR